MCFIQESITGSCLNCAAYLASRSEKRIKIRKAIIFARDRSETRRTAQFVLCESRRVSFESLLFQLILNLVAKSGRRLNLEHMEAASGYCKLQNVVL